MAESKDVANASKEMSEAASEAVLYTEREVRVPLKLVGAIVGTGGCNIKAISRRTNTGIANPVIGGDPVFVVSGRPDNVADAAKEISSFERRRSDETSSSDRELPVSTVVTVPYALAGSVVGPRGANIIRIQEETNTHILSPTRDSEPTFVIRGRSEGDVAAARKGIEASLVVVRRNAGGKCGSCGCRPCPSRCSRCKAAFYCSKECQLMDWLRHRRDCEEAPPLESV